jgi:outer membrane protein
MKRVPLILLSNALWAWSLLAQTNTVALGRPLSLDEAYDRALATDQNLQIAYEEIQKSDLLSWSALTRIGPRITGNGGYSKPQQNLTSTTTGPVLAETWRADITVQQPLLDSTVFAAYRAGKLSAQAARLTRAHLARSVLLGVTRAYYNVLKKQRVVAVIRQSLELAQQQLDLAQNRSRAGEVTRTDVLRAQVTVERGRRALVTDENDLDLAQKVLGNALNLKSPAGFLVLDPPPYPTDTLPLDALQQLAAAKRDDVRAAGLAIDQGRQHERETRAQYLPRLVALWNDQWLDPETFSSRNNFWQAGLALQWPLIAGGQREVDLKRTQHETKQSELSRENLIKAVALEVDDAWLSVQTLAQSLKALEAEV